MLWRHKWEWRHILNSSTKLSLEVIFKNMCLDRLGGSPRCHKIGFWVGPKLGLKSMNKRKIPFLSREPNYCHPARGTIATPTELCRLHMNISISRKLYLIITSCCVFENPVNLCKCNVTKSARDPYVYLEFCLEISRCVFVSCFIHRKQIDP
jgi:hypothetical protein